jgi:non-heme chloroperoxidase
MASMSERERREIEAANASRTTSVVFIHGLWLLPSSWANWADFFTQAGYAPLTPDWPDDPETVEEARANPDVLAKKTLKQVADHTGDVIGKLERKPAVIGHSTGGLSPRCSPAVGCRQPRLPSTRVCFAASCRCRSPRSGRLDLSC